MQRRQFLKTAAATLAFIGTAGRVSALPMSGPRLLVVFLRGAYDAANIIVPVSSDFYYAARPTLAIPNGTALALDSDWGLHPALREPSIPCGRAARSLSVSLPEPTIPAVFALRNPGHDRALLADRRFARLPFRAFSAARLQRWRGPRPSPLPAPCRCFGFAGCSRYPHCAGVYWQARIAGKKRQELIQAT